MTLHEVGSLAEGSGPRIGAPNTQGSRETKAVSVPPTVERCSSTISFGQDICRICHCETDPESPLITPCYCSGSLRYVHQVCLQQWIKSSDTRSCELCKFNFIMQSKMKPFSKWERLEMTSMEQRKLACSVTFHIVAISCVIWSLYVLIEKTTEEVQGGSLEWPFWTKLIVVAIGFTGGLVFMYVQCKMYIQLCHRWRAFNRVIYIQNAPDKVLFSGRQKQDVSAVLESGSPPKTPLRSLPGALLTEKKSSGVQQSAGRSDAALPPGAMWQPSAFVTSQSGFDPHFYSGQRFLLKPHDLNPLTGRFGSLDELHGYPGMNPLNPLRTSRKGSLHSAPSRIGRERKVAESGRNRRAFSVASPHCGGNGGEKPSSFVPVQVPIVSPKGFLTSEIIDLETMNLEKMCPP